MANELQETLNNILNDKNTNLLPENLKQGVTCLGVEGTLVSGDFGSITAVPADVKKGKKFIDSIGVLRKGTFPDISYNSSSMMSSYGVVRSDLEYYTTSINYYRNVNLTKQFNGLIYNSFNGKLEVENSTEVLVELELTEKPYIMSVGCKDIFDENSVLIACTYSDRIDFYIHNYVDNTLGSFGTINASDYDMQPDSEGNFYPVCFLSPYYNFISISWGMYDNTNKSFCWLCKLNSDLSFDKVQKLYGNTASNRGSYFSFTFWASKDLVYKGYGSFTSSPGYLSLVANPSMTYLYGDGVSSVKIDNSIISVDMDQKYCITNPSSSKTYYLRTLAFSSSNVELGDTIKTFTVTNRISAIQTVIQGDLIISADYNGSNNWTSRFYKLDRNTNSVTEIDELIPNCEPNYLCGNLMFLNYGSKTLFYILVETIQNITSMSYDNKSFINTSDATAVASDIVLNKIAYVNGQKITGVIPEYKPNTEFGEQYFIASKFDKTGDGSGLLISGYNSDDGLFRSGTYLGVNIGTEEQSQLAELIDLTADKILEGNTILGIEGTVEAGGIDTSDATATVKDILAGKTAYVDGEKLEGTMANNGDLIITPNTDEQDHSAGYYNSIQVRPVTSSVDTNIKAENIKSGISILGVSGSLIELNGHELEVTPATVQKVIEPEDNYNAITKVTVEAVTSSIDSNIIPENIKSGVSILGVDGNLQPRGFKSNVFMQETEPETKEGIWLQGDKLVDKIEVVDNLLSADGEWDLTLKATIPTDIENNRAGACAVGDYIYIFGGTNTSDIYKYNIVEDSYEKLEVENPPSFFYCGITSVGTDIYIVGSHVAPSSAIDLYKFDTLTNTSTNLGRIPNDIDGGDCVAINNIIYIFAGTKSVNKYDINTNEYTKLADVPENMRGMKVCTDGIDIYLFGGYDTQHAYKYNVSTDTYSPIDDVPYNNRTCRCIGLNANMYIFGGNEDTNDSYKCYRYDTISNEYIQLDDIPNKYSRGALALADTSDTFSFYLFGGDTVPDKLQIYRIPTKTFSDNTIIVDQSTDLYKTQIYANENIKGRLLYGFNDVYYNTTENGLNNILPTYYGTGTEWIKFKN